MGRILNTNLTTPCIINFTSLAGGPLEVAYPAGETAGTESTRHQAKIARATRTNLWTCR